MTTEMLQLEIPTFQEVLKDSDSNEQFLEELLCKFQHWLKLQMHLPQDISDQRLKFILIATKFNFEKAKKSVDMLYSVRHLIPELYSNLDPFSDDIEKLHNYFQCVPLPKLTPENYRVIIARIVNFDSSVYDIWAVIRYWVLLFEIRMEEDTISNIIIIWDWTGFTVKHLLKYTPSTVRAIDTGAQAYCARVKAMYMINAPQCTDIFMKIAKSIMRTKLFDRIHLYASGIESVYNAVPKSLLPVDYGGEQPSMNTFSDMWRKKLAERRDWFLEQDKCKTNESLRTNSVFNPQELYGVPGTFRQLSID